MPDNVMSEDRLHSGEVLLRHGDYSVIECNSCQFRHVLPFPSEEELKKLYEEEFYQSEKANYLDEANEDFAWKRVEMLRRFHVAEQGDLTAGRRALDIGSGPGDFLMVAKERGWQGKGIEPSSVAADFARSRGLDVDTGLFDRETAGALGKFDFIHMSEVLEHVPNPEELLQLAVGLLNPGGMICVSTPNDFNGLQEAVVRNAGRNPWWVLPSHHLNYFDFDSLKALMERSNLSVELCTTNFPMELFLLMGQDYTSDPGLGREMHGMRKKLDINLFESDPQLLEMFYETLAAAGLGRLAIVFARKGE